jgi:hypothetical protein
VVFNSCQPHASDTNLFAYNDQMLWGSTTTSPLTIRKTASIRLHHYRDLAIMQLHRRNDFATMSTLFGVVTHDMHMQDYDFNARFESLPNFMTQLDTRGTTDEEMTPRVLIIGIPAAAQEQDGHSKPKKPKIN